MPARLTDARGDPSRRQRATPRRDGPPASAGVDRPVASDGPEATRWFVLHQAVGNRAVATALALLQRSPDDKGAVSGRADKESPTSGQAKAESPGGDLEL